MEEYKQGMELLMLRNKIREESIINIVRFQSNLNLKIKDRIELLSYNELV